MDVLFGEAVHFVEIEFQRAHNVAIVIDRHCEQRLDFPLAAQVRVEHKLGADILGAQHLPGTDAGSANRRFQRDLASQGQSRSPCSSAVTDSFSLQNSNRRATCIRDARDSVGDQRHRPLRFEVPNLNLVLRFDDLGQRKRVVAAGTWVFFRRLRASLQRGLSGRLLLPKFPAVQLQAFLHLPRFAVVLLDYISGFQQLFKSLLVENWFVFLIGHNRSCGPCGQRGRMPRAGEPVYLSAIPPP